MVGIVAPVRTLYLHAHAGCIGVRRPSGGRERRELGVHVRALVRRLPTAAVGMLPVSLIGLSAFGLDLRLLALAVLVPALVCLGARAAVDAATRRLIVRALVTGIVATALYDLWRGSFLWSGLMDRDPIPHIGVALGLDPAWLAGYGWRYLGNGTGLALAFLVLGLRGTRIGIVYGLFVCSNLLLVLLVSPYGEQILFELNLTTVVMAIIGHVIYGAVLGTLAALPTRDVISPRAAARRAACHG
jgi:hypothetical protein